MKTDLKKKSKLSAVTSRKIRQAKDKLESIVELKLHNQRMLILMNYVIDNNINGVSTRRGFLESIGFASPNFYQIKNGAQSFTPDQISVAGNLYCIDFNFFFNGDHTKMLRTGPDKSAYEQLLEATVRIGLELKKP